MSRKIIFLLLFSIATCCMVQAQRTISWAFTNYPPANFQTENGEYGGFLYEIIIEAFEKRLGIPVIISIYPWKRCQFMVEQGVADILTTIPTPERLNYSINSERPIWIKRRLIYTYSGHPNIEEIQTLTGLEEIKEKNFTVVSYLGNGWIVDEVENKGISVDYANDVEGMYRMLAAGRADIIIEEPCIAQSNIKNLLLGSNIIQTKGVGEESHFHVMIGKDSDYADIFKELDPVIDEMWHDGTIENILSKYGM